MSGSDSSVSSASEQAALNDPDGSPTVSSPCLSICVLDENDICMGCFRSGEEITDWCALDQQGKQQVLKRCVERRSKSGLVL